MTREMKNSGIDWIGQIPADWEYIKIKYVYNIKKAKLPSEFFSDNSLVPYLTMDYIRGTSENLQYAKDGDYCDEDDLLLIWDGSNAGEIIFNHPCGYAPSTTAILKLKKSIDEYYAKYYLKFFETELRKNTNGMGIPHVDGNFLKNSYMLLPPLTEQNKIADFLDSKVSEIDKMIEETKSSIENYKEYKQSVITEAVTKGLNKNVQMKETDSEWIGHIPAHWNYTRIQNLYETVDVRNSDPDALLLSLYTAIGVRPRNELEEKGNKAVTVLNYKKVQVDDVIVNKLLAWMGAIGYSDYEGVTSPDYDVYRAKENANVVRDYYNAYFRHTQFKNDCYKYGHGIMLMRWRTYPEELLRIKVPNPPYEEQIAISEYLNSKCSEIDNLISEKEALVSNLEEYKKSLIYECVTGKKTVSSASNNETVIVAPIYPAVYNTKKARFAQAVLMSKILDTSNNNKGRVKLEKTLYTIEHHIGFDFETEYTRDAAGPLDNSLYKCETIISSINKWFNISSSNYGVSYKPTKNVNKYKNYYNNYFADYNAEIERIIGIFDNFDTDQAEIIATLYGVWNDFVIDNKTYTDEDVVNEVLNNWHDSKKRFAKDVWLRAMDKMRTLDLIPKGYGKKTVIKKA